MSKILHIITGLSIGGAETLLYRILGRFDRESFELQVISLTTLGHYGEPLRAMGIPVTALGFGAFPYS